MPRDILKIATHNGAEALGILGDAGTLEPGKRADLVVLSADPLADIHNTRQIEKVMQGGAWLDSSSAPKRSRITSLNRRPK